MRGMRKERQNKRKKMDGWRELKREGRKEIGTYGWKGKGEGGRQGGIRVGDEVEFGVGLGWGFRGH